MKKIMTLFIILSMLLGLVACGSTVSGNNDSEDISDSTILGNSESENNSDSTVSENSESEVTSETTSTSNIGYNAVVTTGQSESYDKEGKVVELSEGDSCYGQDAIYDSGVNFSFTDNEDGTISDNNTGLIWIAIPDAEKFTYSEAVEYVENLEYAGYDDWRLPTPEELFSISDFTTGWPYLDTDYFLFNESSEASNQDGSHRGGKTPEGEDAEKQAPERSESQESAERQAPERSESQEDAERQAPERSESQQNAASGELEQSEKASGPSENASKEGGQFWTGAISSVEDDERLQGIAFGVNHVTGHIKAYPMESAMMGKYVRAVRGDIYGTEDYTLNDDGTTTDNASGLMWTTFDLGVCVDWETALELAESSEFAGYTDWRLPDVKELQSIVDYSGSYPAINQVYFDCTVSEENENFYYWSSTSAYSSTQNPDYEFAWYVAFGYTNHGAGAVRNLPKVSDSETISEDSEGDRDDTINFVRLVRTVD